MSTNSRYTHPPEAPASAWARHIDAVRRERNLSQTATFRLLREAVDLGPDSRSAFLPYLVDKEPTPDQAKALAAIIGWPPAEPALPQRDRSIEQETLELLREQVAQAKRQADALEAIALAMLSGRGPAPASPEQTARVEAFFGAYLARTSPRLPIADPVG